MLEILSLSVPTFNSLSYIPKSVIFRSYGNFMPNCLRIIKVFFRAGVPFFIPINSAQRFQFSYTFTNNLKPIEWTTSRVNPNLNYELWVMDCWCRFINCSKCTILWREMFIIGKVVYVGGGSGIYGLSLHSSQFCCEPNTSLKTKS